MGNDKLEKQRQIAKVLLKLPGLTKKCKTGLEQDLTLIANQQLDQAITQSQQQNNFPRTSTSTIRDNTTWQSFHIVLNDGKSNASVGEISVYSSAISYDDFCQHEYDYLLDKDHRTISVFRFEQTVTHHTKSSVLIKFTNFVLSSLTLFEDWNMDTRCMTRKKIEKSLVTSLGFIKQNGFSSKPFTKQLFSKLHSVLKNHYGEDLILQTSEGCLVKFGEIEITITTEKDITEKCFQYLLITPKENYLFYGDIDYAKYANNDNYREAVHQHLKTLRRVIQTDTALPLSEFCFKDEEAKLN